MLLDSYENFLKSLMKIYEERYVGMTWTND